ncbi:endo-beta-N-acetylglucosaminidase [Streptomyces sp. NBC_01294]|uniref:endo-beta-N-acetylglucosaminidase n=1 Tax=Streptomyces sp. NBC_01294 TaxID=2903815 RepID=UPI002DD9379D|nr:endo-beta-N-acetylglucosaminidase [Streptomyces sp. NBC_01294]WRZ56713.1 endo-beta-N-acetylglucosaminidase [Streptomyces sp. NBC_01294]
MSETDHGVDPRTPPAPVRPTRRALLAAGAGAAALLGAPGLAPPATAATAAAPARTTATVAPTPPTPPTPADLAPYASYWFPDSLPAGTPGPGIVWRSLRRWTPESDPDLAHNTATVPLAQRFTPVPANRHARAGQARIAALVSFGPTAGNPSQGSPTADYYALSHWAYIDELVFWGGSAGEGIVLAPNAPVVDAAHRNGVRVLGNVFLPPVPYGGDLQWTRDLVRRDALGRFPIADQLVRVARAYGFDGWFVNAETDGGDSALAGRMREFLRALRAAGEPHGLRITWYDAMNTTGRVGWQGALNQLNQEFFEDRAGKVADTMFVDFRWTPRTLAASGALADRLGRSRYELWAAVDTEAHGWNSAVRWDAIIPRERDHVVGYGFYRPEWTRNHLTDRSPGAFHRADDRFWTGESLDPARPAPESGWRAPATVVADRSTVAGLPFACSFNTGHGLRWYDHGKVVSDVPWNHLGLQDRLPGRRWAVDTAGVRPGVSLDFDDAWRGGSSLLVAGALTAPATIGLHSTRLPLSRATVVELVHATGSGPVTVEIGVATREPTAPGEPVPYIWLAAGSRDSGQGWRTTRAGLAHLAGSTAYALAVRITALGTEPVAWRLGALSVRDEPRTRRPAPPTALRVDAAARQDGRARLRLSWRRAAAAGGQIRHYEVSRILPDGTRRFLGGTCGTALHLPDVPRAGRERAAAFEVRAVDELYAVSAPARTTLAW